MRSLFVVSGIVALTFASPALSKPGNGHGNGHLQGYGHLHGYGHLQGYGREGHGRAYGRQGPVGYGVGGCPPGLAKKQNGCMPPGQAKKLLGGQNLTYGLRTRYGHQRILTRHPHSRKLRAD
jgi:hypothetical protein